MLRPSWLAVLSAACAWIGVGSSECSAPAPTFSRGTSPNTTATSLFPFEDVASEIGSPTRIAHTSKELKPKGEERHGERHYFMHNMQLIFWGSVSWGNDVVGLVLKPKPRGIWVACNHFYSDLAFYELLGLTLTKDVFSLNIYFNS